MPVAPVRLHDHAHTSAPPEGRGKAGSSGHGHAHSPGHGHDDGHPPHSDAAAARPGSRHHSHRAGERHPSARPAFSLLRLSALQRLAIALPMAAALWAMALAVIGAGA